MKKVNLLLIVVAQCVFLLGCTSQELLYSIDNYGEEKAYILDENENIVTLDDPTGLVYFMDIPSTSSDYVDAVSLSMENLNDIEGINLSFSYNSVGTSDLFTIYLGDSTSDSTSNTTVIGDGCGSSGIFTKPGDTSVVVCSISIFTDNTVSIAVNNLDWEPDDYGDSKFSYSHIVFYEDFMDNMTFEQKYTISMHELGHTMGLRDYGDDESEVIGYSLMYYLIVQNYTEYTVGDKYNLEWYYTNGGN
jgi:hypothetical protein